MAKLSLLFLTSPPILSIFLLTLSVDCANVLAVLPSVWQSHYIFGKSLLEQLVADDEQKHTVTLISGFSKSEAIEKNDTKIREIQIEKLLDNWRDMGLSFDIEQAHQQSMLERFTRLIYAGTANVDLLLADVNVRKLLRSEEKFDLLIIDLFLSDALLGLALYYNVPTVVISPNGANTWLNSMIGNPQSSALDPIYFLPYTERMSVWERCANTLMGLFEKLTYNFFHIISQQAVYVKHFQTLYQLANNNSVPLPHHRDLTQNLSLALLNSHPVIQYPRAFLPNVLSVGGIHLQQQEKSKTNGIPNHLKSFIESSSMGAIYISFGADARTIDLAREKLDALFDVISYMEEFNFLLKWESADYPRNLPQNVLVNNWFPQEAILAHKNVKAFISACGLMSVLESINGLTPLLAIPIYPEQFVTAKWLEVHGLARIVDFDDFNYGTLLNGLKELTINKSYHETLVEASQLLHADYGTPKARFLHYIDLVLRTGGADYLKTHAHHLNFLRAKLFDVIAILLLGFGGILAIPFLLICCILKRSYYCQNEAAAAAAATMAPTAVTPTTTTTATSIHRSNSKLSLNLSKNLSVTRVGTKLPKNISLTSMGGGVMAATMSVPASPLQNTTAKRPHAAVARQLSASSVLRKKNDSASPSSSSINKDKAAISLKSYYGSSSESSLCVTSSSDSSASSASAPSTPEPSSKNQKIAEKRQN